MTFRMILLFLIGTVVCKAQVVINEFSASNIRDFSDDYDKGEDWIELYNNSDNPINIGGWYLSDKINKPKKWQIPAGTTIDPKGFMTFWASGRNSVSDGNLHTNFRFTQTSADEYVVLSDNSGKVIESYKLPITLVGHSIGKSADGSGTWVVYTVPSFNVSNNDAPHYTSYTPTPKIDKVAGAYTEKLYVKINNNSSFTCRYTLDGSLPNEESPILEDSLEIVETAVFKARFFASDSTILPGKIAYATYFIDEPTSTLPIVSVASELALELAEGNRDLKPYASLEFFSKEGTLQATSYGELDSHGQDSWVNPQRSIDWISRDEMGYNSGIPYKLFNYSERKDFQRIILRASGDDNYPSIGDIDHEGSAHIRDEYVHTLVQQSDMKMDVRAVERALLYINGKYWGVYTMREKPDDTDYTEYTYKQDKYNVQFLKTWGNSWAEYGGNKGFEDWAKVRDFILNNDMSYSSYYNRVLEDYNVTSLMDYMIANLSVVSSDWLNYNTGWWRGLDPKGDHKKWGYVMWDNDATFDYYINYSGVPNIAPDAKACDIEGISQYMDTFFPKDSSYQYFPGDSFYIDGEWVYFPPDSFWVVPDPGKHEKIFLKLLEENETFRNQYYARYADMISTTFSCENMLHTLDSLVAIIQPEMPRQVKRWGGNMSQWQKNINKMRNFISQRCTKISAGMIDCYDELKGPYSVTLISDPPNAGTIKFNTLTHESLPWTGTYFGGMDNAIEVKQNGAVKFKKWVSKSGNTIFDNASLTTTNAVLSHADTLIAVFENGLTASEETSIGTAYISPNPASTFVTVHTTLPCTACTYSIIDNLGKTVQKDKHSSQSINIESLVTGIYTLKISDETHIRYVGKVMVVR